MLLFQLLQINVGTSAVTTPEKAEAAKEMSLSLMDLAIKGGWIMIPIILLSIISIYILVERSIAIKNARKEDANFMNNIKEYILDGKIESALTICKSQNTPLARMIEKGIRRLGRPLNDVNTAIENVGKIEVAKLEKGFAFLATSAGAAPMLGFLGTVTGMIRAFYNMASAGNNIDITLLSSGIYEAMVTTVAGLIVGIMAYLAYNYLVARVEHIVNMLEARTTEFMDLLNEPVK
ncbi:MAG: biopolymer transporter ExbB [Bacteroidetes bacterium GWF2_33_38]|nr:MAG: biopolymer transporter ExbB [Bacteroidetes bacterium GWF2_33_38]OFY75207.1 MAG: biopolymer transporter ExbB [Bacteroidetes bacterium RIFOXYA12_FULL_33_9]OFY91606.1 MAG: biopolymer transporter ExbB [Bacteroidetes bacterium RIFOXYA2_FULL_33_7]HBX52592.1 biopolymer transporter ExbB [Bacteroidales bacterium]